MRKNGWLTILIVLLLLLGSIGMGHAEIIPAYGEGQIGLQAVVLCETLTVRQEPSSSSKALKTLHSGDWIIVQPETGGWAKCFLSDDVDGDSAGWVNEDYLAIDPAWYRTENKTTVYAWNDTMAPKVALLDENTTLPILKNEGAWLLVGLRGAAGWIAASAGSYQSGRREGERFEAAIMLEGMEETVHYEHAVNSAMGVEIDYDYESFQRSRKADGECFVSVYDNAEKPENYLELKYFAEDAGTVAAAIIETLSKDYDITVGAYTLDRAGSCVQIDASVIKGTNIMSDILQTAYVIPAANGCIVATEHVTIESAEGFGVRMDYMMNSLSLLNGRMK